MAALYCNPAERAAILTELRQTGSVRNQEVCFKRKDGTCYDAMLSLNPVTLGGQARVLAIVSDITERKRSEVALRASEAKYRTLFETMAKGVVYQAPDGRITSANPAAERILGLTVDQMQGRTSTDPRWRAVHEDGSDFEGETHPSMVALRTGQPVRDVVMGVFHPREERYHWININAVPQFQPGEERPHQVYTTFEDITERKAAEDALRESRQMLQLVLDSIPVRVFWKDRDSVYLGCNRLFAADAGLESPEQIVGMNDFQLSWVEQAELYRADDRQVAETGESKLAYEEPQTWPDGTSLWLRTSKVPLRRADGAVVGILGTYEDITERKRADEALREREERFRQALAAANAGAWEWEIGSNRVFWSEENFRLLGFTPGVDEPSYEAWLQSVHPDDREGAERVVQNAVQSGEDLNTEYRVAWPDGSVRWVNDVGRMKRDPAGTPVAMYGIQIDITKRRRAEEALRASEQRFAKAFGLSPDAIGISSLDDGRLIDVNESFVELSGWPRDEIIGRSTVELGFWPEARAREEWTRRIQREGRVRNVEMRVHDRGGVEHTCLVSAELIELDGDPHLLTYTSDVTREREAQERLRESEARFRAMFESAAIGAALVDLEGRPVETNAALQRMLGYSDEELRAMVFTEFTHPDDVDADLELYRELIAGHRDRYELEKRYIRKDGATVWGSLHVSLVLDRAGAPQFAVALVQGVTDRKAAEAVIRASHEQQRMILSQIDEIVYSVEFDPERPMEGAIRFVSDRAEQILGYGPEEFLANPQLWVNAVHPDDRPNLRESTVHIMQSRSVGTREYRLRHKRTGEYRWMEDRVVPRLGEQGELLGLFGVARDMTERRRAEDQVRGSRELLRRLAARLQAVREEERTAIAREIHDELGQALTGVKMDLSWLVGRLPKNWKAARARGEAISELVDRTIDVVRDISTRLRPSVLDDLGLAAAVEWQAGDIARRSGIDVQVSAPIEGPELDREHATALFRIFQEALINVVRHAGAKRVSVSLRRVDRHVELEVADDGKGISADAVESPMALGLLGMRERAVVLGGDVEFQRGETGGTVVTARIPLPAGRAVDG